MMPGHFFTQGCYFMILQVVSDCWMGRKELWKVFWIPGMLVFLLQLPGIYALERDLPQLWWLFYSLVLVAVQVWWIVSVWRCAANSSRKLWMVLSRAFMVYWGGKLVFSLIMLFG